MFFDWKTHSTSIRIGRTYSGYEWFFFDGIQHLGDGDIKLWITTIDHQRRISDDLDVRVDTMAFNTPGAVIFIEAEAGNGDEAAVDRAGVARNPRRVHPRFVCR